MKGEENHDSWLNLSLSPPQQQPPRPAPETQPRPPVYLPIQQPHQGMDFPAQVPIPFHQHHLPAKVAIPSHQHHHNTNQDQPSSSRQVLVPGVVTLQDNQHQTVMTTTTTREAARAAGPSRLPPRRGPRRQPLEPLLRPGKNLDIPPPYPWATCRRAYVQSLDELLSKGIRWIKGQVQCKHCEKDYSIEFDLQRKFTRVTQYILRYNYEDDMHQRAPDVWKNPVLPRCRECGRENSAKPVIGKKRTTNWLFLLLGQMLGCCTIKHLKYFCKHTLNHRTGAKDRLLFLTYMGLCKQVDPSGPFDVKLDNFHAFDLPSGAGSH
ncbi:hypothetical protein L6164_031358 [Bauhinia variegata]|uniref:Uncharacterized protein n=1 Tax=Bauhinia variegata TaxID=167791 RepID=A0ACB9LFK5_BAUVA|nr:hypothetical protein L6164_031358 [Bauhinia variegata]